MDTYLTPKSYEIARLAAGACVTLADTVYLREVDNGFAFVRPPGHHATPAQGMGFCLFNNVAVGAAHALAQGLSRVAIVDVDVHHGNGTQAIFEREPRVLYVSSHAWPFYPGTGAANEVGEGPGRGFTVNLPLPRGCGDEEYAKVYREIVEPVGKAFDPELVLVSLGFDPYRGDPIAPMRVSERGFAEMADVCLAVASEAARGRAVFVLEGGYDLDGIAKSAAAVTRLLLGERHERMAVGRREDLDRLLAVYRQHLSPHWPVLRR
jgi:acetoin utilization deacetylase AcuC-like enzyme